MSALVLTSTLDMERDEWLEARRRGIGGSDAAAILGLSPWRTALDVYLEKIGEAEPIEMTEAIHFGNVLEDVVAQEFARRTGKRVRRRNAILKHADYPYMLANVDRFIVGGGLLECKTTNAFAADAWEGGKVPEYYLCQVQHYLAVTGEPFAYVAVLIGGQRFEYARVERDEALIATLIDFEAAFWEQVQTRTPPRVDGSKAATELLKTLFPNSRKEQIKLPSDAASLFAQYEQARAEEQAAKERKDEAANLIKQMLGENEAGVVGDWRATWAQVTSQRFDSRAFRSDYPELYEQYQRESSYRRFAIK